MPLFTAGGLEDRCRRHGRAVTLSGMVTTDVAAELLNMAGATLRNWRTASLGPRWVYIRGRVWYPLEEIACWLNERVSGAGD